MTFIKLTKNRIIIIIIINIINSSRLDLINSPLHDLTVLFRSVETPSFLIRCRPVYILLPNSIIESKRHDQRRILDHLLEGSD